ncbi:unnamed protein product [Spirodela intermedia]|uniref:Uncharacterized protein n=1 Tax=Spirodela intermedia TaxID=51605 RepID=A0A7I8JGE0_SPIIN|nr:unnamed protein product [Spirodela intermedia]CAA6668462.1 unnamed protein product [Spirodela intermedia]
MLRSLSSSGVRRLLSLRRASPSSLSSFFPVGYSADDLLQNSWPRLKLGFNRSFSSDLSPLPAISDPDVEGAFRDLMAASWDEIPESVVLDVKNALSKASGDEAGQATLTNVFRAAEASTEFGAVLVQLRMALDDTNGLVGENAQTVPDALLDALAAAYKRYMVYLDAFGPEETYLRKKVEIELGTKMVHLKMRCSGLGAEWGKVSVLGTSGLSGSYVEHRAR